MSRGIVIVAENNSTTDYIECATVLAKSIRATNPGLDITLLTGKLIENSNFDRVVVFPHGDVSDVDWKLANDWQVYSASPYDETIKIESDVVLTRSIDSWWAACENRDLAIAHGCVNHRNTVSTVRYYREFFDRNNLPDVYNGIVYFKQSVVAEQFFYLVRQIFEQWDQVKTALAYCPEHEQITTDVAYAIAANTVGVERCLFPESVNPLKWAHLKAAITNSLSDKWHDELFYEIHNSGMFRIASQAQYYPVHYVDKHFAREIGPFYD